MNLLGWALAGFGAWLMLRSDVGPLTLAGGAGSQLEGLSPADLGAIGETSGQIVSGGKARPLGLTLRTPSAVASGWAYLYLRSDAEARAELAATLEMVKQGGLRRVYVNPEGSVVAGGAASFARLLWYLDALRTAGVAMVWNGYSALLTRDVADRIALASPEIYPLDGSGQLIRGEAGQAAIERAWDKRCGAAAALGMRLRPTVFIPGHEGGPKLALLARLVGDYRAEGVVGFSMEPYRKAEPLEAVRDAAKGVVWTT